MNRLTRNICYIIFASLLIVSFQNCGSEHMQSGSLSSGSGTPTGLTPAEFLALQNQALSILQARCASCHDGTVSGTVPDVLNIAELRGSGYVIPGQPQNSPLMLTIYDGTMPEGGPNLVNTAPSEVITVRDWIQYMK